MGYRNTNEKGEIEKKLSNYSFWMSYGLNHILHIKYSIRLTSDIFINMQKVRLGKFIFSCKKRASWLPYSKKMVIDQELSNRIFNRYQGVAYQGNRI